MLFSEIWVDGQHLDEPHPIDLPLLVQSLHVPGCYEIFPCKTAKQVTLTFDRAQMVHAVQACLETVRALVGDDPGKGDWPVYGLSVQDVLKIDPNKPFYETEKGAS